MRTRLLLAGYRSGWAPRTAQGRVYASMALAVTFAMMVGLMVVLPRIATAAATITPAVNVIVSLDTSSITPGLNSCTAITTGPTITEPAVGTLVASGTITLTIDGTKFKFCGGGKATIASPTSAATALKFSGGVTEISPSISSDGATLTVTIGTASSGSAPGSVVFTGYLVQPVTTTPSSVIINVSGTASATGTGGTITSVAGQATSVVFTTQPATTPITLGTALTTQPVVEVRDRFLNKRTGDAVTLALISGTFGAVLSCSANPVSMSGGVTAATFAGCKVDKSGTGYALQATSGGILSQASTAFSVNAVAPTGASVKAITGTNNAGYISSASQSAVSVEVTFPTGAPGETGTIIATLANLAVPSVTVSGTATVSSATATGPFTVSGINTTGLADGPVTVTTSFVGGATSATTTGTTATKDSTAPTGAVLAIAVGSTSGNNATTSSVPSFTVRDATDGTGTGIASVQLQIRANTTSNAYTYTGAGATAAVSGVYTLSTGTLTSGTYDVRVEIIDKAGNTTYVGLSGTPAYLTVDLIAPTMTVAFYSLTQGTLATGTFGTAALSTAAFNSTVTVGIQLTAPGTIGTPTFVLRLANGVATSVTPAVVETSTSSKVWRAVYNVLSTDRDGATTLAVASLTDAAGNQAVFAAGQTPSFIIDNTAPTFQVLYDRNSPMKAGSLTITVVPNEALISAPTLTLSAGGTITLAETTTGSNRWSGTTTTAADATVTVTVSGTDQAGNVGTTITSGASFVVDNTAPATATVNLSSTDSGSSSSDGITSTPPILAITADSGAIVSVTATLDGTPFGLGVTTATYTLTGTGSAVQYTPLGGNVTALTDGLYEFTVATSDAAGNAATSPPSKKIRLDRSPPTVTLAYSGGVPTNATGPFKSGDSVAITATFTEPSGFSGTPTLTLESGNYTSVDTGGSHSCGQTSAGVAACWGQNDRGQLGDGTSITRTTPVAVAGNLVFTSLSVGGTHTCGLVAGIAYCWGANDSGQLGNGTTTGSTVPVAVTGGSFASLRAGGSHTCGITSAGQLFCWGGNGYGQIGDASATNRLIPTKVSGTATYTTVVTGDFHTCAQTTTGLTTCWGRNDTGQLGDGTTVSRTTPTAVLGTTAFTDLAVGGAHSCGLTATRTFCWGANTAGQLGDATTANKSTPTLVSGTFLFTKLALGANHTCGLTATATYCWGGNTAGQLGDATTASKSVPTLTSGTSIFTGIDAGGNTTCATTAGTAVFCWGDGTRGQIGDGASMTRTGPSPVTYSGGTLPTPMLATGSYTASAGTGTFTSTIPIPAGNGPVTATVNATDLAGNALVGTLLPGFTIDNVAPIAPTGIGLSTATDTGSLTTDRITNTTAVVITGSAEAYATIALSDSGTTISGATGTATATGSFSIATTLTAGSHPITAIATDQAGNTSVSSTAVTVLVDTVAPTVGTLALTTTDSGSSAVDGIINTLTPTFSVTGTTDADSGVATVAVQVSSDGGTSWTTKGTSADTTAPYTITLAGLTSGTTYKVRALVTDIAGNSATTAEIVSTPDTTPPNPGVLTLSPSSQGPDGYVKTATPIFAVTGPSDTAYTGTGAATSGIWKAEVEVSSDNNLTWTSVGMSTVSASSIYTITTSTLTTGTTYNVRTKVTDTAGNSATNFLGGTDSSITVDTTAPTIGTLRLTTPDSGESNSDGILDTGAPVFSLSEASDSYRSTPTLVAGGGTFANLTAGATHTCASSTTAVTETYCWGDNSAGQLGDATTVTRNQPTLASKTYTFTALAAGGSHTCGISTVATATYCWGYNGTGQVGDGTTANRTVPTLASSTYSFTAIAAGGSHSCGLTTTATYCWGSNASGQLGDATTTTRLIPTVASNTFAFTSITAGSAHTCGLTATATYCWGSNASGQLGDATTTTRLIPTVASTTFAFTSITAGSAHTCGLTATATYCWGSNASGQLGDGTTTNRTAPTAVTMPTGVTFTALATGSNHTCALTAGGVTYCWGANLSGQIGDGSAYVGSGTRVAGVKSVGIQTSTDGTTWTDAGTSTSTSAPYTITATGLATNTTYQVRAIVTDKAGNTTTAALATTITIDTTAPTPGTLTIVESDGTANDGWVKTTSPTFTLTGTSDTAYTGSTPPTAAPAKVELQVSGNGGTTWTDAGVSTSTASPYSITLTGITTDGTYKVRARVTDKAGNSATTPTTSATTPGATFVDTMVIDRVAPTLTLTEPVVGLATNLATPTFRATATDSSGIAGTLFEVTGADNTTYATVGSIVTTEPYTATISPALTTNGVYQVRATATDISGNATVATSTFTFDTVPPSAPTGLALTPATDTGTSTTDGITNTTLITVTGTAEANATITLFDGGTAISGATGTASGSGSFSVPATVSAGSRTITAKATDAAGNVGSASTGLALVIDTTVPRLTTVAIADPLQVIPTGTTSAAFTVTFSEAVTGITTASFVPVVGPGMTGITPTVTSVTGSGTTYTVTVSLIGAVGNGSFNASTGLTLAPSGLVTIVDAAGNFVPTATSTGLSSTYLMLAPPPPTPSEPEVTPTVPKPKPTAVAAPTVAPLAPAPPVGGGTAPATGGASGSVGTTPITPSTEPGAPPPVPSTDLPSAEVPATPAVPGVQDPSAPGAVAPVGPPSLGEALTSTTAAQSFTASLGTLPEAQANTLRSTLATLPPADAATLITVTGSLPAAQGGAVVQALAGASPGAVAAVAGFAAGLSPTDTTRVFAAIADLATAGPISFVAPSATQTDATGREVVTYNLDEEPVASRRIGGAEVAGVSTATTRTVVILATPGQQARLARGRSGVWPILALPLPTGNLAGLTPLVTLPAEATEATFDPTPTGLNVVQKGSLGGGIVKPLALPFTFDVAAPTEAPITFSLPTIPVEAGKILAYLYETRDASGNFLGYLRAPATFIPATGRQVWTLLAGDVKTALILPVSIRPAYVQSFRSGMRVYAGPYEESPDFGVAGPQFTVYAVVGPQVGQRISVLNEATGNYGWIDANSVGPTGD